MRGTNTGALRRQLRGELDWIVMKALEKDRSRRYATPGDLARDTQRYLDHEPVLAGSPTATYRLGSSSGGTASSLRLAVWCCP